MRNILKVSILPALLLALASAAYANTVQLGSYGTGDSSYGNANTALAYVGYTSTAPIITSSSSLGTGTTYDLLNVQSPWSPALAGSSWVSIDPTDGCCGGNVEATGYYTYTTTFSAIAGATGELDVLADDTAELFLNGALIGGFANNSNNGPCAQGGGGPTCNGSGYPESIDAVLQGTNTLTIVDWQSNGSAAGVDFAGSLTETPEPSSLLLLSTGLLGLAFVAFRKAKASGQTLSM